MTQEGTKRLTINIPEAAKILGISRNSAYGAARRGDLPTIVMGRRILVPVSALERILRDPGSAQT